MRTFILILFVLFLPLVALAKDETTPPPQGQAVPPSKGEEKGESQTLCDPHEVTKMPETFN